MAHHISIDFNRRGDVYLPLFVVELTLRRVRDCVEVTRHLLKRMGTGLAIDTCVRPGIAKWVELDILQSGHREASE